MFPLRDPAHGRGRNRHGKTLAYLVPAILSGRKVIVSTGTKDAPGPNLRSRYSLSQEKHRPKTAGRLPQGKAKLPLPAALFGVLLSAHAWNKDEAKLFRRFQKWAATSSTGDRAEIEWLPDNFRTWNEVCSSSEHCLGQQCSEFSRCHLTRLRNEAARANIVVVNHHLFFADLALRRRGRGEVIPEYQAVVFDEAHQLEDVVGEYFGIHLSSITLAQLAQDILKECRRIQRSPV